MRLKPEEVALMLSYATVVVLVKPYSRYSPMTEYSEFLLITVNESR